MRENMHEGKWSPFDPTWYQAAFDKFICTADELFNQDLIIDQGFHVPDADGSKSSVFRTDAVLNNSFNEKILRETLRDIYSNSSNKLIAVNHDNIHYFQWHGHMSDMTFTAYSNYCEFHIPIDSFISPKEKDLFKLSQYSRKWIKVEDILNHWEVFPWHCMVFIDRKISSEYEFHIDDCEVILRFPYYDYWKKVNHSVDIYKFDTNAQARVLISRELCENQWNWKMPMNYITEPRVSSATKLMVAFNKTADPNIRTDGLERIEFVGDNLEFVDVVDGYIDLTKISKFNRIYIKSEPTEFLWVSIVVPRFFHEYPILLPADVIYSPYEPMLMPVVSMRQDQVWHVKADDDKDNQKQVYVDMKGKLKEVHDGWSQMIRPVILSDAFDNPYVQPYDDILQEIDELRDLTVAGADAIERFRIFLDEYTTDTRFNQHLDTIKDLFHQIHDSHNAFMDKHFMDYDHEYEKKYNCAIKCIENTKAEGFYADSLHSHQDDEDNFFNVLSPGIYIPRELVDKYYVFKIIYSMAPYEKILWEDVDKFMNRVRFQRPIEESNFWTFEYDLDDRVWRPYPLKMEHHFPDVYLPSDPSIPGPAEGRLFKTFFFYTDMPNNTNLSREVDHATPDWSDDSQKYYFNQGGTYRDIFMEKFYWMGVRTIYRGLLKTDTKWEILEHIINNPSYERFNELFMKTMDPYFKLGLATYLKTDNVNFPFDDAIDKLQEVINTKFLGYKRVTNFEAYLDRSWIPSYFDYVTKIMDNWDYSFRLLRRPRNTFDIDRLLPILIKTQREVFSTVRDIHQDTNDILAQLAKEDYKLNVDQIKALDDIASEMDSNMTHCLKFTQDLDLEIYSIDDINHIIECLKKHFELTHQLNDTLQKVFDDTTAHKVYPRKQEIQREITYILEVIPDHINRLCELSFDFSIEKFMLATNDLRSYLEHDKFNPEDDSLLGYINKFDDAWSTRVKEKRNKYFQSTVVLYGFFDPKKSYSREEIVQFVDQVETVSNDLNELSYVVREFWVSFGYKKDQNILDRFDYSLEYLKNLKDDLYRYLDLRDKLLARIDMIYAYLEEMMSISDSLTENLFYDDIHKYLEKLISALSYIVGQNQKLPAVEALQKTKNTHTEWVQFVAVEEDTFEKILAMSAIPSGYVAKLLLNQEILEAAIEYMDTVNIPYMPDEQWPTYADVYAVDTIEMISGGLLHKVGDEVYIPKLGSYKITELKGNIGIAKSMENLNYRNSSFRNPMWQYNPYDSITNGDGMGIAVRPLTVLHTPIINNEVIVPIIQRIQNAIRLVTRCIAKPNPYNDNEFNIVLRNIKKISNDWDNIVVLYVDHMTVAARATVSGMTADLMALIPVCEKFMESRSEIDLTTFIETYQKYIFDVYAYSEKTGAQNSSFEYYDNMIRTNYNEIADFYGNGSIWDDAKELKRLLDSAKMPINFYRKNVVALLGPSDELTDIQNTEDTLLKMITLMTDAINILPEKALNIEGLLKKITKDIEAVPTDIYKHVWYKMKFFNVAVEGNEYKVGDIVELVPELPIGEDEHWDQEMKDLVMNDKILFQVTQVEYGRAIKVQPLIDYALPYKIWGLRDTNARVGRGFGLRLDIYSYEIQFSDITIFDDVETDVSKQPPFDENDLFMFWFDNTHDLDIGYEVFLGGKQISNFIQRHETVDNPLHPRSMDVLYLNANDVMGLQNSSIYIPAEHYFVYRIDKIEVKDPGAGYCVGQDIFVDTDQLSLRLKVASLIYGPTKGIGEIDLANTNLLHKALDPASDDAHVSPDSMNNIDDEFNNGYYDMLPAEGVEKSATKSHGDKHVFTSRRFDDLPIGDRNAHFMHPEIKIPESATEAQDGDPDYHYYPGFHSGAGEFYDRVLNLIPPTHPFIADDLILPPNQSPRTEFQEFARQRMHNSERCDNTDVTKKYNEGSIINTAMIPGDLVVESFSQLPRHTVEYLGGRSGKNVIVEHDETHGGHRMLYRIRTFIAAGFFVYDLPEIADYKWNTLTVDWMDIDSHPDDPSTKAIYPTAPWNDTKSHRVLMEEITDKKHEPVHLPSVINNTSYIHQITLDDISVFNWTTRQWEDLHDESKWKLDVVEDSENKKWGFTLAYLEEGIYSYDMSFYWNKKPDNQARNAALKRNAILSIASSISHEVNTPAKNISIYTGRHLRIRKLFPYEQKESYRIGKSADGDPLGYEMNFKLAPYIHFKNEIHLEDIKIFNKTAGRFEDILNPRMFEVRFKDPKATERGYETQTKIVQCYIGNPGEGFIDGDVWGWNETHGTHIFGHVTTDGTGVGGILTFVPDHFINAPTEDMLLEFQVFQHVNQATVQMAVVVAEFQTRKVEVYGDGYIHNVTNKLAPVPDEFKVIVQYNLDGPGEYDIVISKRHMKWGFRDPKWQMSPSIYLGGSSISQDSLYVLTDQGRFPLVNPSNGKPSLMVSQTDGGTIVKFLNVYKRYEKLEVCAVPYPMKSVYVQRRIPTSGYIDLAGKINKPLNKKYFEFWVNGKLLFDEVTIVTPTKLFLHGLTSLKNFEIIEVNRDPHEYFSDVFIETESNKLGRPKQKWNYRTYLDDALEGTLEGDNYTAEEQEYLLTPVWKQVDKDHPEYRNYPPNVDIDPDILIRTASGDNPLEDISIPNFQFMIVDVPTIEGYPIMDQSITFGHFGFIPIDNSTIVEMLNEEWKDEIANNPYFPSHAIMSNEEWYGMTARLYDEYGIRVHTLDEAAYQIADTSILRINVENKVSRIVKKPIVYDLT